MASKKAKPQKTTGPYRNRIVRHELVDPKILKKNPANWRAHGAFQRNALRGLLGAVGWVDEVKVSVQTGLVVDGHMRIEEAIKNGEKTVPVAYLDLTQDEERIVLASLDPIGDLADPLQKQFGELIEGLDVEFPDLEQLWSMQADEAEKAVIGDYVESSGEEHEPKGTQTGLTNDVTHVIKPVIKTNLVPLFEEAMSKTGKKNRGEALQVILETFLGRLDPGNMVGVGDSW